MILTSPFLTINAKDLTFKTKHMTLNAEVLSALERHIPIHKHILISIAYYIRKVYNDNFNYNFFVHLYSPSCNAIWQLNTSVSRHQRADKRVQRPFHQQSGGR